MQIPARELSIEMDVCGCAFASTSRSDAGEKLPNGQDPFHGRERTPTHGAPPPTVLPEVAEFGAHRTHRHRIDSPWR